jgi:integrase
VRSIPLNNAAERILRVLCEDVTITGWLFVNREGKPLGSFKKGWQRACEIAGIEDLRPYDLRHTFATRLVERYVPTPVISALLGHSRQSGGVQESRITTGYAHATWEAMQRAVESLEYGPPDLSVFQTNRDKIRTNADSEENQSEARKVG